jgi:DNA-binding response OmpR family regulator
VREILAVVFQREGWSADAVGDGEQAVQRLGTATYVAVILDLLMPRLDGAAVIAHMRENGIRTPVVVLSAVSSERGHELDSDIVRVTLQKPFEIGELRAVVRAVVQAVAR